MNRIFLLFSLILSSLFFQCVWAQPTEITKQTGLDKTKGLGNSNNIQSEIDRMMMEGKNPQEIKAILKDKYKDKDKEDLTKKQKDKDKKDEEEEEPVSKQPKKFPAVKGDMTYSVYGQNIFSTGASPFEPQDYQNPPDDYVVGPGDVINVVAWGDSELDEDYKIDKDGSIFPEKVGRLVLNGMKAKVMKDYVKSQFRQILASANTKIEVSITKVRVIRVNIVGEVVQPGAYNVSALTTAFNAIYAAGGPSTIGSLRAIYLKRGGKVIDTLDVYNYLLNADFGKQIYLEHNDIIQIPIAKKVVELQGEVKRPLSYELSGKEGLKELMNISGGFLHTAYQKNIQIKRIENHKEILVDVNYEQLGKNDNFPLNDGDIIEVRRVREGLTNTIEAKGAFNQTGLFQLPANSKLGDLLKKTEGVTSDAYLSRAYILRINADLDIDYIPIDLSGLGDTTKTNAVKDITLMNYDIVKIFSRKEFKDSNTVEIKGLVRSPGTFSLTGKVSLKDVLYFAGGLKEEAANTKIEVSRILKQKTETESRITRVNVLTVGIKADLSIDQEAEKFIMSPYDQVFVRKNPDFNLQENVSISGQVMYPGEYSKLERTERISSLIQRAGGLREKEAYLDGATLVRSNDESPEKKVAINLKKALSKPNSKFDVILREGDKVHVPLLQDVVSIQGSVQSPTTVVFDGITKYKHYINYAGGYKSGTRKNKSYVTYANGSNRATKNYFFFRVNPKIEPGATLVAIPKTDTAANVVMARAQILTALVTGVSTLFIAIISAISLIRK